MMKNATLLFIMLLIHINVFSHPMGITNTKMYITANGINFSIKIFYSDLKDDVRMFDPDFNRFSPIYTLDTNDIKILQAFLNKHFKIEYKTDPVPFTIKNTEFELHEEEAYILNISLFSPTIVKAHEQISISNTIMFDTVRDQKNIIHIYFEILGEMENKVVLLDNESKRFTCIVE